MLRLSKLNIFLKGKKLDRLTNPFWIHMLLVLILLIILTNKISTLLKEVISKTNARNNTVGTTTIF